MSPKRALQAVAIEKQHIENRVKYLAKEQQKYQHQIERAEQEISQRNKIQTQKLMSLREKI